MLIKLLINTAVDEMTGAKCRFVSLTFYRDILLLGICRIVFAAAQ